MEFSTDPNYRQPMKVLVGFASQISEWMVFVPQPSGAVEIVE